MAAKIKLQIDNREMKLVRLLSDRNQQEIEMEVVQLPIADIVVMHGNTPVVAIERKTISDLCASIKDSRYKEQKERLLKVFPKDSIMYLIEGEWSTHMDEMAKGAIINTMLRDKIKVFLTPSIDMTAQYIVDACKRIAKNPPSYIGGGGSDDRSEYADALSQVASIAKKRDHMDARTFSILSLSLIPGVSKVIAKAIVEACGLLGDLSEACHKTDGLPTLTATLADIKLPSGKRIGKVVSSRIVFFLSQKNEHL